MQNSPTEYLKPRVVDVEVLRESVLVDQQGLRGGWGRGSGE